MAGQKQYSNDLMLAKKSEIEGCIGEQRGAFAAMRNEVGSLVGRGLTGATGTALVAKFDEIGGKVDDLFRQFEHSLGVIETTAARTAASNDESAAAVRNAAGA